MKIIAQEQRMDPTSFSPIITALVDTGFVVQAGMEIASVIDTAPSGEAELPLLASPLDPELFLPSLKASDPVQWFVDYMNTHRFITLLQSYGIDVRPTYEANGVFARMIPNDISASTFEYLKGKVVYVFSVMHMEVADSVSGFLRHAYKVRYREENA